MPTETILLDHRTSRSEKHAKNKDASLIKIADHCVACGLCLPHCPTYRKTQSEADSPRGRIALMRGVLEERLPFSERFIEHIDLCLTCHACERACPNNVAYGELVDGMRVKIETKRNSGFLHKLALRHMMTRPRLLQAIAASLRIYVKSGAQSVVRKSGLLKLLGLDKLERNLPPLETPVRWKSIYPVLGNARAEVGLFLGCIARTIDTTTLRATTFVLNRLGYTVIVPPEQNCCGALHSHSGERETAINLAQQNMRAFDHVDTIISTASGCGAQLGEYDQLLKNEFPTFSRKVVDIATFLNQADGWDDVAITPLNAKIVVHDPCTLRNVMRQEKSPYELLKRIPGVDIKALPGNDQCCGGAGNYFLHFPEMADSLVNDKINALKQSGADYLVSANIGCALFMRLRNTTTIEILHPVVLLARQMGFIC